jgi:hypothetical protein
MLHPLVVLEDRERGIVITTESIDNGDMVVKMEFPNSIAPRSMYVFSPLAVKWLRDTFTEHLKNSEGK